MHQLKNEIRHHEINDCNKLSGREVISLTEKKNT